MKETVKSRVTAVGNYIVNSSATVRKAAQKFGISKSTVHKDVSERLKKLNPNLYESVRKILKINKSQRHIRGGIATKRKFKNISFTKSTYETNSSWNKKLVIYLRIIKTNNLQ